MFIRRFRLVLLFVIVFLQSCEEKPSGINKLAYHYGASREGWNDREEQLTPIQVASEKFGLLWESPEFQGHSDIDARVFATPLYVQNLTFSHGVNGGSKQSIVFAASSAGWVYAILAQPSATQPAGTVVWEKRLTTSPCFGGKFGILSTPVIDLERERIYITACENKWSWKAHALDLQTGSSIKGWPLELSKKTITPELNKNGNFGFNATQPYIQRGALNLNASGSRLYVTFGPDMQGWLISIDTMTPEIKSVFSSMPQEDMEQGGMWGSSGPAINEQGHIYVATGASFGNALANGGIAGVYPESDHAWGQSILQFKDDDRDGLTLLGTYAPFNYCQTAAADIDIAGSGPVLFDMQIDPSSQRRLLALGPGKQGVAYLLDRERLPGNTVRRQACSDDPSSDTSLLAPDRQPELDSRGPVVVFGPYSDSVGMGNSAKSRSTLAHYMNASGEHAIFLTGSSKTGQDNGVNVPPGLVKLTVESSEGGHPFLRKSDSEFTQTLKNPGSPIVTSNSGKDAIVWVLDPNVPRSVDVFSNDAPPAKLYAFDAESLKPIWKSGNELRPTGKYNEVTVVNGLVLVGTDRIQAYGLSTPGSHLKPDREKTLTDKTEAKLTEVRSEGDTLFKARCAACHGDTQGEAPSKNQLKGLGRPALVEAMLEGTMREMAAGLSEKQIGAIADALATK